MLFQSECFHSGIDGLTMKDFIKWMTGSKTMPPLGFPKKFTVQFVHGCEEGCHCRPTVSTCDTTLNIPVHINSEEDMVCIVKSAVKDCSGFGNI
jgi:hypothetical protein